MSSTRAAPRHRRAWQDSAAVQALHAVSGATGPAMGFLAAAGIRRHRDRAALLLINVRKTDLPTGEPADAVGAVPSRTRPDGRGLVAQRWLRHSRMVEVAGRVAFMPSLAHHSLRASLTAAVMERSRLAPPPDPNSIAPGGFGRVAHVPSVLRETPTDLDAA